MPILIFLTILLIFKFAFSHALGDIINKIEVKNNDRITTESIITFGGIELGKDYTQEELNKVLLDLYSTNFFSDIKFDLQGDVLIVELTEQRTGDYRYISLQNIVNNYMMGYVGDGKLIPTVKRTDVLFHAKRGIQEFSYDITKVEKIQEVEIPSSLSIPMPQDYVDYVQISRIDDLGVEHPLYPARHTSIPSESIAQSGDGSYLYDDDDSLLTQTPEAQRRFKDANLNNGTDNNNNLNNLVDSLNYVICIYKHLNGDTFDQ